MPTKKRRKHQIRQRQLRRRKNASFKELSVREREAVAEQEEKAVEKTVWDDHFSPSDTRRLYEVARRHGRVDFKQVLDELSGRFPGEKLEVLDEGAGRSTLYKELPRLASKAKVKVTRTDVRKGWKRIHWPWSWPDKVVNVMGLAQEFGKKRFHLVVSTESGVSNTALPEKAIFQIVEVLKPRGIGMVTFSRSKISEERIRQLAKRFNITIRRIGEGRVFFTKNQGRKK